MMQSPTLVSSHKPFTFTSNFLIIINPLHTPTSYSPSFISTKTTHHPKPISATIIPSSPTPPKQQVYQPFRPPPSPLPPKFRNLDTASRLEVLANRLGLWYEYAPLIPSLIQEGFTPPSIEEATGISGVEQNRLVVAAQVRDSLLQSNTDPDIVSSFDTGGAELLYEIRLLSVSQRAAAVRYIIDNELDAKGAQDLARALKDFPRRRGDKGWECFEYSIPGDCLSFMYFRQSREYRNPSVERTNALERALVVAVSENAKGVILKELEGENAGKVDKEGDLVDGVKVPVVRLRIGEVAEAKSVVVLPICRAEERVKEVLDAPWECRSVGEFGIVVAEKGWSRWVVLPRWEPVVELGNGGVVVAFGDARVLPWKVNRWYKEEPILVVADRGRKEVNVDDGFYLVDHNGSGDGRGGGLKVERGSLLKEKGVKESLGTVVLVVRPPKEEAEDQLNDEDWE